MSASVPKSGYVAYSSLDMGDIAKRTRDAFIKLHPSIPFDILPMKWGVWPDGTESSSFGEIEKTENRHVIFFASFSSNEEKLRQLSAIYVLTRRHIKTLTVMLPFSPTATMERLDAGGEGVIATADVDAHFFSTMPKIRGGPIKLLIYDLHTLQNRFYFHDGVIAKLISTIPIFKAELLKLKESHPGTFAVAFPDDGAAKRFGKFFHGDFDVIVCGKVRTPDNKRIVTISDGDPKDKYVVILDDLIQTGGTMIACRDALMAHGATAVSAFGVHAIFPQEAWKKFLGKGVFDKFWITDTCPKMANFLKDKEPFTVISVAEDIAKYL